jgi:hypothetical protein
MLNSLISSTSFRVVGFIAATFQSIRQLIKTKQNILEEIEQQRATVHGQGFTPEDLASDDEVDVFEDEVKQHLAVGALCILNAYIIATNRSNPLDAVISAAVIAKSGYDIACAAKKRFL